MGKLLKWVAAALASIILGGCASVTAYQPHSHAGGYKERPVGTNRYFVEFFGNAITSRDTVLVYWLHRCAELTALKGFDYFVMLSKQPPPGASLDDPLDGEIMRTATITTWSARSVIEMKNGRPYEDRPTFVAQDVLKKLGPVVRQASNAGTNVALPKEFAQAAAESDASGGTGDVKLDDLDALLPKQ